MQKAPDFRGFLGLGRFRSYASKSQTCFYPTDPTHLTYPAQTRMERMVLVNSLILNGLRMKCDSCIAAPSSAVMSMV